MLVFDAAHSGHHAEYVVHLLRFCKLSSIQDQVLFLLPIQMKAVLPAKLLLGSMSFFRDFEEAYGGETRQFNRSIIDRDIVLSFVKDYPAIKKMLFLNIDPYQYVINTRSMRRTGLKISGILFHHFHREVSHSGILSKIKLSARKAKKQLQLAWMLGNRNLDVVHVLNDELVVQKLNVEFRSGKTFKYLPDPINLMDGPSSLLPEALESDSGKVKLLVFGSMNARKNVLRIIQAVDLLGSKEYQLFIVGKAIEGYAQKIKEEVERNPEIDVILLNYFLPADEILSCFEMADIVLIPYVDFYGSSGILNTAIMYGKPVVCADVGLIPDIVNAYGIGVKVDPRDVKSIAKGIESAQRVDHRKISDYISSHQPSVFSKCLFYNEEN